MACVIYVCCPVPLYCF